MIHGSFSRGTTPEQIFTLPFEKELVTDLRITYVQSNKKIITKNMADVEIDGNDVKFTLSQEETFKFSEGENISVQLKIKTTDNLVFNSDIINIRVDPTLDDEVI